MSKRVMNVISSASRALPLSPRFPDIIAASHRLATKLLTVTRPGASPPTSASCQGFCAKLRRNP
jgi:hypothetical protein